MRLQVFSFDYPPNDGGIARLCAATAAGLEQEGYAVHVLSQDYATQANVNGSDGAVTTTRVQPRRPWREWEAFRALRAMPNGDLFLSGIWYPEGLIATLAGVRPHVVFALGAELFPPPQWWRRPLWWWLKRKVLESADVVLAISDYTEHLVKANAPSANVRTVPLAVDHHFFTPGDRAAARRKWQVGDKRVLCSVSRVHRFKGHDVVLRALANLPPEIRNQFIYLVAGKGPDVETLQEEARSLGVDQQVRWLGFVPEADLPSLYRAADLFVLMTRELPEAQSVEGFGLVFLEAQACGTPVVGTLAGGIPDAVAPGEGGWLVEQDDVTALTRVLEQLAADPVMFVEMGERARRRVEREFTWEHYIARLKRALQAEGIELE